MSAMFPKDVLVMIAKRLYRPKDLVNFAKCSRATAEIIRHEYFQRHIAMYLIFNLEQRGGHTRRYISPSTPLVELKYEIEIMKHLKRLEERRMNVNWMKRAYLLMYKHDPSDQIVEVFNILTEKYSSDVQMSSEIKLLMSLVGPIWAEFCKQRTSPSAKS